MKNNNNSSEILELNETEEGSFELYSSYIGVFGIIKQIYSKKYYVYYVGDFKGFLKTKHIIFITQSLNKLNKYDEYKRKMKDERH